MTYPPTVTVALVFALTAFAACVTPRGSAAQSPRTVGTPKTQQTSQTNQYGAATKAFRDRIQEYVTFHNNVEKMVPPPAETSQPEEITRREEALGAMLIKQRPNAQEGDFFIKEYQPYLIKIIQDDFARRPMADRRALLVELPKNIKVGVNTVYPPELPLATFPANLLKLLPELPKALEYRIVGQHLILRDVTGNIIIDVLRNAVPIPR